MNPPLFSLTVSAGVVAWYGAIVATLGLVVQALNFLRDQKSAKVTYSKDMIVSGGASLIYGPDKHLQVKVVNVGRRPFTISYIGLQYNNGIASMFPNSIPAMPCELREGQSIYVLVKQEGIAFENILWFEASDVAGTDFRINVAPLHSRLAWRMRRRLGLIAAPTVSSNEAA